MQTYLKSSFKHRRATTVLFLACLLFKSVEWYANPCSRIALLSNKGSEKKLPANSHISSVIFYGNCHSCFPILYDLDRDIRQMTNMRVLRSRYSPPPQAAKGSVSKQLLDDERFLAKYLQKSFWDASFFFSCVSSSSSSSSFSNPATFPTTTWLWVLFTLRGNTKTDHFLICTSPEHGR